MSRVALVTGGNRGIGLATAAALAAAGNRVAVTYRSTPPDQAAELGLTCVSCDVTDPEQVDAAFTAVEEQLGPVEILVSNAGMTHDGLALRLSDDDFTRVVDANLAGGFRVAKRAVRSMMRGRWGRIVFVGSVVGHAGQVGQVNYAASKAGLIGLARSLAREFASRNITVNVVAPGPIATDMFGRRRRRHPGGHRRRRPPGPDGRARRGRGARRLLGVGACRVHHRCAHPVDGGLGMGT